MSNAQPTIGVPRETREGEFRVAMTPAALPALLKAGATVMVESGAGLAAGFPDAAYVERGATIATRDEVFAAPVLATVRVPDPDHEPDDVARLRSGQVVVGMATPFATPESVRVLAERGVTLFALELVPRTTRAQAMDVLSSQANVAGYKAVLLAASTLPKMYPLLTTAAGTIAPAKVLVIGAGVAGLSAIATARRLGAVVEAYDVRPAVKEEIESLGARFVELPLETGQEGGGSGAYGLQYQCVELVMRRTPDGIPVKSIDVPDAAVYVPRASRFLPGVISKDVELPASTSDCAAMAVPDTPVLRTTDVSVLFVSVSVPARVAKSASEQAALN